jgi:hypothetical protein
MSKLEDLQPSAAVRGILPDALVTVVSVQWFGSEACVLITEIGKMLTVVRTKLLTRPYSP